MPPEIREQPQGPAAKGGSSRRCHQGLRVSTDSDASSEGPGQQRLYGGLLVAVSMFGFVLMAGMLLRIFLQGPTLRSVLPALPAASGDDYSTDEDHVTSQNTESSHSDDDKGVSASSDSDEERYRSMRSPQENGEVRQTQDSDDDYADDAFSPA